jgi:hypothetical protein
MLSHRSKTLRLAPGLLHHRVNLWRKLSDLADETFERSRGSRTEHLHKASRRPRRAAGQQCQRRPNNPQLRQPPADTRQAPAAPDCSQALWRHRQPLGRWVNQHETDHAIRIPRRVSTNDKAAEGMPYEDATFARPDLRQDASEFVNDLSERAR